jgi:hypothetical protein
MALQYSVTLRDNQLAQIQATLGTAAAGSLVIFSGAVPTNCAAASPTGPLCTITLPTTFMTTAASGTVTMTGTWQNTAAAAGTAACFRIFDSTGTNCHAQGNVTSDLVLNNTSIAAGQTVSVTGFTVSAGNA